MCISILYDFASVRGVGGVVRICGRGKGVAFGTRRLQNCLLFFFGLVGRVFWLVVGLMGWLGGFFFGHCTWILTCRCLCMCVYHLAIERAVSLGRERRTDRTPIGMCRRTPGRYIIFVLNMCRASAGNDGGCVDSTTDCSLWQQNTAGRWQRRTPYGIIVFEQWVVVGCWEMQSEAARPKCRGIPQVRGFMFGQLTDWMAARHFHKVFWGRTHDVFNATKIESKRDWSENCQKEIMFTQLGLAGTWQPHGGSQKSVHWVAELENLPKNGEERGREIRVLVGSRERFWVL